MGNDYTFNSNLQFSCTNTSNSGSSSNYDAGSGYMKDSARSLFLAKWIERSKNNHKGKMHRIYTHHSGFMKNAANMKALMDYIYDNKIPYADIKRTHTYKLLKKLEDAGQNNLGYTSAEIIETYKNKKPFELDTAYIGRTHNWNWGSESVFLREYGFKSKKPVTTGSEDFIKAIEKNFKMSTYGTYEVLSPQEVSIKKLDNIESALQIYELIPVEENRDVAAKAVYRMSLGGIDCEPMPWFLDYSKVCTALVNRAKDFAAMFDSSAAELACDNNEAAGKNYCTTKRVPDEFGEESDTYLCADATKTFDLVKNNFYITYSDKKILKKSDIYKCIQNGYEYTYTIKDDNSNKPIELDISDSIKNFIEVLISQQAELAYSPFTEDIGSNEETENIANAYKSWANLSIMSNKNLSYSNNNISIINECVVDHFTYEDINGEYISIIKSCNLHDITKMHMIGDHTKNVVFNINYNDMQYPHIEKEDEDKDKTPVHYIVEENHNALQTINPLYTLFVKGPNAEHYVPFDENIYPVSDNDRNAYNEFLTKNIYLFKSAEKLAGQLLNPCTLTLKGMLSVPVSYLFATNTGVVRYKNSFLGNEYKDIPFRRSYMLFIDTYTFGSSESDPDIVAVGILDPDSNPKNMSSYTQYSNIETRMIFPNNNEYNKFKNICSSLRGIQVSVVEEDPFDDKEDIEGYSKWFPIIQLITPTRIESNGKSVMCIGTTGYPFKYKPQEWYGMQPELNSDTVVKAVAFEKEIVIYTETHSRKREKKKPEGITEDAGTLPTYECRIEYDDIPKTFKFVKWRPFAEDGMLNVVFFPVENNGAKRVIFYNSLSSGKVVSCEYIEAGEKKTKPIEYSYNTTEKYQDIVLDLPHGCSNIQLIFEYTYKDNNTEDNNKIFNTITDQNIGESDSVDSKTYSYMRSTCSKDPVNDTTIIPSFTTGQESATAKGVYPKNNGIKYYVYNTLDLSLPPIEILGCCNEVNSIAVKKTYSNIVDMIKGCSFAGLKFNVPYAYSYVHQSTDNSNDHDGSFGVIAGGSRYLSRYFNITENDYSNFLDEKVGWRNNICQEEFTHFMTYYNNVLNQVSGNGGKDTYDIKREILETGVERCLKKIDVDLLKYALKFSDKQPYTSEESKKYNIGIDTTPVTYKVYNSEGKEIEVNRRSNFSIRYRGFPFKEYLNHFDSRGGNVDITSYYDEYQGVSSWGGGWTDGNFLSRTMVGGESVTDPIVPIINLAFGVNIWVADKTDETEKGKILVKNSWMTDGEKYYVFEYFKFFLSLKDPNFEQKEGEFSIDKTDASYYFSNSNWHIHMVQNLIFEKITWSKAYEDNVTKTHIKEVQNQIQSGSAGFKANYSLPCENYKIGWEGNTLTIAELKTNRKITVVFKNDNDYKMRFSARAVLSHVGKNDKGKWMSGTSYSSYNPSGSSSYNEGIFLPLNYGIFKKAPPMYKYQIIDRGIKFYTFMPSIWAEKEPSMWAKIGYSVLAVFVFIASVVLTVVSVGAFAPVGATLTATAILSIVGGTLAVAGATVGLIATLGGIWGFIDAETLKVLNWVSAGLSAVGAIFSAGAALNAAAGTLEIVTAAINLGASVANFGVMVTNVAVEIAMEQEQEKLEKEQEIFKAELEVRLDALDNLNDYLFSTSAALIPRDALNLFRVKRISEGVIETPTEFFNRTKNIDSQISYYKEFQFTTVENFVSMTLSLY